MATVIEPRRPFNASDSDRRVRHPLEALRGHIRRYVFLEGLAVAVLYLAVCFWVGLALDYGLFSLFAIDWIQELQQLTVDAGTGAQSNLDFITRVILLGLFLGGLVALVFWKMLFRLTREFSDPALALVLERRFPKELGDRLITAVELADPKVAEKYGFSKTMIENTIQDAADRVEKVPVTNVFDWARLRMLGLWCFLLTVGMYLAVGVGTCAYNAMVTNTGSPTEFFWNFNDTATIWTERNILLMNSYWPRHAHLEVIRFQDTPAHRGEMRVGRDEQRPDLQIRAVQWVVADHASPDGWRALRWHDLPAYLDKSLLDQVAIPKTWGKWLVDLDDLDPAVPGGILPSAWQGKTLGEVRIEFDQPALQENLKKAGALHAAQDLLDWQAWTVDKIQIQEDRGEIRRPLREEYPKAHKALQEVFTKLAELTADVRYSRTLRKLVIPKQIQVFYRGETKKTDHTHGLLADNKYSVGLNDLTESGRFTVRGEDYYTPYKKITLVPPPSIEFLTIEKEEPAYIYYRVQGDQKALKGKKQIFHGYPISVMGESSTIQVPFGTNLVVRARMDRPLKDGIRMRAPAQADDRAAAVPNVPVVLDAKGTHFTISLGNVVRPYECLLEFHDQDNVKGRRKLRIQPVDDHPPEVFDTELDVVLRKPRYKSEAGKTTSGPGSDGFLITPDALLPFKGTLRDDYGLTAASWVHEVEQVEFELTGQGAEGRAPTMVLQGGSKMVRAALVGNYFQIMPGTPSMEMFAPAYWTFMTRLFRADLARNRTEGELQTPLEGFQRIMEGRSIDELSLNALDQMIKDHAHEQMRRQQAHEDRKNYVPEKRVELRPLFKEHSLKDEEGFDLKRYLPRLKALDPSKEPQFHYLVKLSIEAVDNNVETGPGKGRNKAPLLFLVVSENELLGQIAIEEEVLFDRLDKADFKLRNAKTTLDEQVVKLSQTGSDYSLVGIRVDDVRKALLDAGTAAREIHTDYRRILRELEVNRVRKSKIDDVRDKIVYPLGEIVDPNNGNFYTTEAAVEKLITGLDEDVNLKKGDENRGSHVANARLAVQQLERLLQRLHEISIAMNEGVIESKLLELIVNIERDQRQAAQVLRRIHNSEVDKIFNELTK
jgi:hypothetical protein